MASAKVHKCIQEINEFRRESIRAVNEANEIKDEILATAIREDYEIIPELVSKLKANRERRKWLNQAIRYRKQIISEKGQN